METESKYIGNDEVFTELSCMRRMGEYGVKLTGGPVFQRDEYFDMEGELLREHGLNFRVRERANERKLTLKRDVKLDDAVHMREEHELVMDENGDDEGEIMRRFLSEHAGVDLKEKLEAEGYKLKSDIAVENRRIVLELVRDERVCMEVALDRFRYPDFLLGIEFFELEVELKSGNEEELKRISHGLRGAFRLQPSALSKHERGRRLRNAFAGYEFLEKAENIAVVRLPTVGLEEDFVRFTAASVRRFLMGSIPRPSITGIRINDISGERTIQHIFDAVCGVSETVYEIMQNMGRIAIRNHRKESRWRVLTKHKGPGELTAGDLFTVQSEMGRKFAEAGKVILEGGRIMFSDVNDPGRHVATMDESAEFDIELFIERRCGRAVGESKRVDKGNVLVMPAAESPVAVDRVSWVNEGEYLKFKISTNGAMTPEEAWKYLIQK